MVVTLNFQPATLHRECHLGPQVLVVVGGRHREISLFVAGTIPEISLGPPRVPATFLSVNEVVTFVLVLIEAHVVENKKLRLSAKLGRVGNASRGEIDFRFLGDIAWIAGVTL